MSPQETARKVRQLDNEVASIYEILSAIQGTQKRHSMRFEEQAQRMSGLEAKVDGLGAKVDGLDAKVDSLAANMDTVLEILRAR